MALIQWTSALEIGIPEIDYQHRNLANMLNALHRAIEEKEPEHVLGEILEALDTYAQTHFRSEESLMERLGYAHIDEHKAEHYRLGEAVQMHRHKFTAGECSADAVLEFLIRWLLNHIAGADSHIAEAWRKKNQTAA